MCCQVRPSCGYLSSAEWPFCPILYFPESVEQCKKEAVYIQNVGAAHRLRNTALDARIVRTRATAIKPELDLIQKNA